MLLAEGKGHLLNLKRHRKHLDREGSGICGFKLILSSCLDENLCRLFSVTYFFEIPLFNFSETCSVWEILASNIQVLSFAFVLKP